MNFTTSTVDCCHIILMIEHTKFHINLKFIAI